MLRIKDLLKAHLKRILSWKSEDGQTLVEYGMLVMLLAIAVIGVLTVVGEDVVGLFTSVSSNFQNIANQTP